MKTLNEDDIKTQLKACGVVVENISVELANIVATSVEPEHAKSLLGLTCDVTFEVMFLKAKIEFYAN